MDKLKDIVETQIAFQENLGINFDDMTEKECADFIVKHSVYMEQEIQEALYEMPFFKDWKDYESMSDDDKALAWQKVRMELIDALQFFINMCLAAGHTHETIYHMYKAKNKENNRRQDLGYAYDKTYRNQTVEEVMNLLNTIDNDIPSCAVSSNEEIYFSDDFIALLSTNTGDIITIYNTDPITLGIARKVLEKRYKESLVGISTTEVRIIEQCVERASYE